MPKETKLSTKGNKAKAGLAELLQLVVEAATPNGDGIAIGNMYILELAKIAATLVDRKTLPEGADLRAAARTAIFQVCKEQDPSIERFLQAIATAAEKQLGISKSYRFLAATTARVSEPLSASELGLKGDCTIGSNPIVDPRAIELNTYAAEFPSTLPHGWSWISGSVEARSASDAAQKSYDSCVTLLGFLNLCRNLGQTSISLMGTPEPQNRMVLGSHVVVFDESDTAPEIICLSPSPERRQRHTVDQKLTERLKVISERLAKHCDSERLTRLLPLYYAAFSPDDSTASLVKAWRLCERAAATSEDTQTARRLSFTSKERSMRQALILGAAITRNVIVHEADSYDLAFECSQVLRESFDSYFRFFLSYPDKTLEELRSLSDLNFTQPELESQLWVREEYRRLMFEQPPE